jgi:hypothetical protein
MLKRLQTWMKRLSLQPPPRKYPLKTRERPCKKELLWYSKMIKETTQSIRTSFYQLINNTK